MTSRIKTAYFYDPDVGNFHYGMININLIIKSFSNIRFVIEGERLGVIGFTCTFPMSNTLLVSYNKSAMVSILTFSKQ